MEDPHKSRFNVSVQREPDIISEIIKGRWTMFMTYGKNAA
jgi:hypothetical protein